MLVPDRLLSFGDCVTLEPVPYQSQEKQRSFHRKWAKENPEWWEERRKRNRELVRKLKEGPCSDCGLLYPFYVMDFDHRDGSEKTLDIGKIANKHWSEKRILEEVAKCDLVCANCHRERTAKRGGYSQKVA